MGHTYGRSNKPREQAGIDTSARADGMRAFHIGLPRSACACRHSQGAMKQWEEGYDTAARGARAPAPAHH